MDIVQIDCQYRRGVDWFLTSAWEGLVENSLHQHDRVGPGTLWPAVVFADHECPIDFRYFLEKAHCLVISARTRKNR